MAAGTATEQSSVFVVVRQKELGERGEASALDAKSKERLFASLSIKLKYVLFLCIYYF